MERAARPFETSFLGAWRTSTIAEMPAEAFGEDPREHGAIRSPRREALHEDRAVLWPFLAVRSLLRDVISLRCDVISPRWGVIGSFRDIRSSKRGTLREHRGIVPIHRKDRPPRRPSRSSIREDLLSHRDILSSPPAGPCPRLAVLSARDEDTGPFLPVTFEQWRTVTPRAAGLKDPTVFQSGVRSEARDDSSLAHAVAAYFTMSETIWLQSPSPVIVSAWTRK
jgi:hypothetical protein